MNLKKLDLTRRSFQNPILLIQSSSILFFLFIYLLRHLSILQSLVIFDCVESMNILQSHWRSSFCKVYCSFCTFLNKSKWAFLFVSITAVAGGEAPSFLLALRDVVVGGGALIVVTTSISCGPILRRPPVWWGEVCKGLLAVEGGLSVSTFMWWRIIAICFPLASIFLKRWANSSSSFLRMLSLVSCLILFDRSWWLLKK